MPWQSYLLMLGSTIWVYWKIGCWGQGLWFKFQGRRNHDLCCINWPLTFNNELLTISTWDLVWFTGSMSAGAPANISSVFSLLSKYVCLLWGVYQEWQCTILYISVTCIKSNFRESRIQRTLQLRHWELSILNLKLFFFNSWHSIANICTIHTWLIICNSFTVIKESESYKMYSFVFWHQIVFEMCSRFGGNFLL